MSDDHAELTSWRPAQLAEDERIAREAAGAPWSTNVPRAIHVDAHAKAENHALKQLGYVATVEHEADRIHIANWDPARVLAEVNAKRAVLADLQVLAQVGRMYLDALDQDPENEMLTLVEAMHVTEVREAVERWEPTPSAEEEAPVPRSGLSRMMATPEARAVLDQLTKGFCYCNGDPAHPWHENPIPD